MNPDAMSRCVDCGEPVRGGRFYREITGWERLRTDGGANAITLRQETGRVLCERCMELRKLRGQSALF